ncbi:MAG: hypothetical protein APF84_12620 [Gracilibacter sp. BRH_c7a]|nr:MAG: hypothetical protein APF84_12620 [Gracilibacter sp. BRH_c7a]
MNKKAINKEKNVNQENRKQKNTESISIDGEQIPLSVLSISHPLVKTIDILLWIGESIIIFTKNDWLQLRAVDLKYFAGILTIIAAKIEGQEVKSYTGKLPKENPAKVAGSLISEAGAAILTSVITSEVTRTKKPSQAPIISPFIGGIGAVQ